MPLVVYALAVLAALGALLVVELVRCPFRPRLRVDLALVAVAVAVGWQAGWLG